MNIRVEERAKIKVRKGVYKGYRKEWCGFIIINGISEWFDVDYLKRSL